MFFTNPMRNVSLAVAITGVVLFSPHSVEAQRRAPVRRSPAVRSVVVVRSYNPYPRFYYEPWYSWGFYPNQYPPFGYGYAMRDQLTSSIKLEVTPRQAEVYVDGYQAGLVDDFDGVFQRLRLRPGAHEIVIFLEGYQTIRQNLYVNPGGDQKIRQTMEKLGGGQSAERPPQPSGDGRNDDPTQQPYAQGPGPETRRPSGPAPAPRAPSGEAPRSFGTLSIRVQPGDAEILIDGERWSTPSGQDRVAIEIADGRHHLEIRKPGFNPYVEDVLIRRGATLPLNVSLLRGGAQ